MVATQHGNQINLQTKLERVERRSRQDRRAVFNNLGHLLNAEMQRSCFNGLDGSKAVGIDKVTKEEYGEDLEENLAGCLCLLAAATAFLH